jgi:Zn-finger nucleic acid-binding protein
MHCPLDRTPLELIPYEGAMIRSCPTCGGELLSPEALRHIVNRREVVFGAQEVDHADRVDPVRGIPLGEQGRHLNCPACGAHMDQLNYAGDTRVIVDRCSGCGSLWLDRSELEMAQVLVERWSERSRGRRRTLAGELSEARRRALDRTAGEFRWSRFGFVNALLHRIVDAA